MVIRALLIFLCMFYMHEISYSQDFDNDGIVDSLDLDADNDGIVDTLEGLPCPRPFVGTGNFVTFPSASSGTITNGTISADYSIVQNYAHGYAGVAYTGFSDGIEVVHLPNTGISNDSFSYTFNITNLTPGASAVIRMRQNRNTGFGNNESSTWKVTWVGGVVDATYQDSIAPSTSIYQNGVTDPAFDINERQIGGLDTQGTLAKNDTFVTYMVINNRATWFVEFPVGVTSITMSKVVWDGSSGRDGGYPSLSLSDALGDNGESFREWVTFQVELIESCDTDSDLDGIPNYLDLDADNDGIPDVVEAGGVDTNGDGIIDNFIDNNMNGLHDAYDSSIGGTLLLPKDTDSDGVWDYLDLDADNDGIPDVVEAGGVDTDGDGRINNYIDSDNDGYSDVVDGDVGNDGIIDNSVNSLQLTGTDSNADSRPDNFPFDDLDNDNIVNQLDLDADGDGILDITEAGGLDVNRNGLEDNFVDIDNDGLNDNVDSDAGNDNVFENIANATTITGDDLNNDGKPDVYINDDSDSDSYLNFLDIDSDNDGIVDNTEGQLTTGYIGLDNTDSDNDGIDNAYDSDDASFGGVGSGVRPVNTDGTDNPDYLDLDTDNDGMNDLIEGHDTDGDGVPDSGSSASTGIAGGSTDIDNDGLLDGFDNNTASANSTNTNLSPASHPDVINTITIERDWREINTTKAINDVNSTPLNTTVIGNVLTNDIDQEGNTQSVTGTIIIDGNGDGVVETSVVVGVAVTVGGLNENGSANPNAGTLIQNTDGTYSLVPTSGFVGEIIYTYQVCDNGLPQACDNASVTIDVEPGATTTNGILAPAPDVNITYDNLPVSGQVLANDNDPDGDNIIVSGTIGIDTDGDMIIDNTASLGTVTSIAGVDQNNNPISNAGTIIQNGDGTYTFDPIPGFIGVVQYEYTACDDGSPIMCKTTTVTITVLPMVLNSTNALDDEEFIEKGATLNDNVLINDTDVEGDNQIGGVTLVTGPNNGTLVLNADGTYSYTPTDSNFVGNDEFVYQVCDDGSPQACEQATVYITVLNINKDYGDGANYPIAWHRAISDINLDNVLDGASDIWLGAQTSFENNIVVQDDFDDAISFGSVSGQFPTSVIAGQNFNLDIVINSTASNQAFYGVWIDWNDDGSYDDFYSDSIVVAGATTATKMITVPLSYTSSQNVNIRLRVDDNILLSNDFSGVKINGEIEDYQLHVIDLPVELTHFSASLKNNNTAVLDWSTETELNNKGFYIEYIPHSTNRSVFETIGFVDGHGTSLVPQKYTYEVPNLIPGTYYFRLKQVDDDGTYAYTEIKALDIHDINTTAKLFPTFLSENQSHIYIDIPFEETFAIEIFTQTGRLIESAVANGKDSQLFDLEINRMEYASGLYYVRVSNANKTFIHKIRIE